MCVWWMCKGHIQMLLFYWILHIKIDVNSIHSTLLSENSVPIILFVSIVSKDIRGFLHPLSSFLTPFYIFKTFPSFLPLLLCYWTNLLYKRQTKNLSPQKISCRPSQKHKGSKERWKKDREEMLFVLLWPLILKWKKKKRNFVRI